MERTLRLSNGKRIRLLEGDITRVAADAIANAANSALAGGGGVDGAIHRAGGPEIMHELGEIRGCIGRLPAGQAVATTAGRLPAKFVFHAVGPIYNNGRQGEPKALASCYRVCLAMAEERGLSTISFPSISTGVYGYPHEDAAVIALREVRAFLLQRAQSVEEVILVQFGRAAYEVYDRLLSEQSRG
jgi:O-acetyl-ADP-ribose deacetylase (regulator of RNase III)